MGRAVPPDDVGVLAHVADGGEALVGEQVRLALVAEQQAAERLRLSGPPPGEGGTTQQ